MTDLLEQAQKLNQKLQLALKESQDAKAEANKTAVGNRKYKEVLDAVGQELNEREKAVSFVQDAVKLSEESKTSKAEADLEWEKIRTEWDRLKVQKQKDQAEATAERNELQQKKELYERGAQENKITRDKLDKKLKAIAELKG